MATTSDLHNARSLWRVQIIRSGFIFIFQLDVRALNANSLYVVVSQGGSFFNDGKSSFLSSWNSASLSALLRIWCDDSITKATSPQYNCVMFDNKLKSFSNETLSRSSEICDWFVHLSFNLHFVSSQIESWTTILAFSFSYIWHDENTKNRWSSFKLKRIYSCIQRSSCRHHPTHYAQPSCQFCG